MRPIPTRVHCLRHVKPERKQHHNQLGAVLNGGFH